MRIAVTRLGVTSVRFTGGEPLLARHLEEVVAAAAALRPRPEISLTTNGVGLARRAGPRRTGPRQHLAGQRGPGTFCGHHPPRPARRRAGRLGRRQRSGSDAGEGERGARPRHRTRGRRAVAAVLPRIRLPAARHRTDAAGRGAPMAAGRRAECRRGAGGAAQAFSAASRPRTARIGSGPAVAGRHRPGNARRRIRCHRVGLARVLLDLRPHPVDGRRQIRSCLFSTRETDLRGLLRGGAADDAVEAAWRAAMWAKPAGHGINDPNFIQPDRPMSAIGG